MRKRLGQSSVVLACAAALVAAPAARADCWTPAQVRAAGVRELDTLMMVQALRCRTGPAGFLASYNAFVVASRPELTQANGVLRTHYEPLGTKAGADALDRYITRVANRYGAGVPGSDCAQVGTMVRVAMAMGQSVETLADVAEFQGVMPLLDDTRCATTAPLTVAQARLPYVLATLY